MEFETPALQWNNCRLEFCTLPLQLPEREANGWHQSEQNWVILGNFPSLLLCILKMEAVAILQ